VVEVCLLVAALAVGVIAQGGFYPAGHLLVAVLAAVAVLLGIRSAARSEAPERDRWRWAVPAAGAALAAWALARGLAAGADRAAVGAVATIGCLLAGYHVARRLQPADRLRCAWGMAGLGAAVGLTAWLGVAVRSARFAQLTDHGLWRGSSLITYPNAAAALLVPLALLAAGLLLRSARSDPARLGAAGAMWLALTGVGAAASRAGFGVLVLGLLLLAVATGFRRAVAALAGPVLGAVVTVAALGPSVPAGDRPQPLLALAGLLIGAAVTAGVVRLPRRTAALALGGVAALGVVAAVLLATSEPGWLHAILAGRATVDSSGRSGPLHAAGDLIAHHPVTGYGVGLAQYIYVAANGQPVLQPYAHNEYLQILVDLGAIGVALLLALFLALGRAVVRGRRPDPLWAAAGAGLIALAVHSGFDFLWHLAVLPLVGGILAGLATGEHQPTRPKENTE
jgi:hypothetical protein